MTTHYGSRASANHWFEPLSIAWNHAWWASDPGWSKPADGGAVSSWRNAGTQAIAATQATGTSQPLYWATYAALNNQPVVEFDGTDDFLDTTGTAALAQPNHVVVVGYLSPSATLNASAIDATTTGFRHLMRPWLTTNFSQMYAGTDWQFGAPGIPLGSSFVQIGLFNGATSECRVNGIVYDAATLGGNPGTNTFQHPRLGRDSGSGTAYFKGAIAFVGVKDTALTAQEIIDLEAWARSIYGVITPITNPGQVTGLKQWLDASDATSITTDLNYIDFPATTGNRSVNNNVTVPHAADLNVTSDITVSAHVYLGQWPGPGVANAFVSKFESNSGGGPKVDQNSWFFGLNDNGTLNFQWSTDGSNSNNISSTVAPTITNGPWQWVGIGFDVDNGANGYTAKFWKADDVTLTWTQVGTTVTAGSAPTSIFAGTAALMVNGIKLQNVHDYSYAGRCDYVNVAAGVNAGLDPTGGTQKFRINQHDIPANSYSTFKTSSGHTATINRGGNPATSTVTYAFPKSKVSQWRDKSGNNYHVSQATQDVKPWDGQTTLNGRKTLMFDGTDVLFYTGSTGLNVGNATVFVVAGQTSGGEGTGLFAACATGSSDWSSANAFTMTVGTASTLLQVERAWQADGVGQAKILGTGLTPSAIWVAQLASTGLIQAWRNGGAAATSTRATTFGIASAGFLIGGRWQAGAIDTLYRLAGDVAEVVVYDRALTLAEIDLVGRYLATRWGFTWTAAS